MTDYQNNESEFDFENELKYLYSGWELTTIESQILYLTTLKIRYLQSSYSNNLTYGITFDKKCDLEIELLKSKLEFESIKEQLTIQPQQIEVLNESEPEQKLPYKIALLHEIGFFKLDAIKKLTKENQFKIISSLTGATHRTVKGNVNVLDANSNEDRMKYTSNNFLEQVKIYLDRLK
jgi:hypothetical protein